MYNAKLEYKLVVWVFYVISLWKEKVALIFARSKNNDGPRNITIYCSYMKYTYIGLTLTLYIYIE